MVDVVGRAEVDTRCGRDGWKMEDEDGGRTGFPDELFPPKSGEIDIFLDVRRN